MTYEEAPYRNHEAEPFWLAAVQSHLSPSSPAPVPTPALEPLGLQGEQGAGAEPLEGLSEL